MTRTVGIDLGTTYSLIAYQTSARAGRSVSRPVRHSAVSIGRQRGCGRLDHRWRIRTARLLTQPQRTIYSVKRLMGAARPMCRTS